MGDNQVFPLLSLPPEIWGLIYSKLDTKEDRRNFTHTCNAIHGAKDIKQQITKLVLHFPPGPWQAANRALLFTEDTRSFPGACLKRLEIRDINVTKEGWMHPIDAALRAAGSTLEELSVVGDNQYNSVEADELQVVCAAAPPLKSLHLGLVITKDVAPLQHLRSLEHLEMKKCDLWEEGVSGLPHVLRQCTGLQSLVLPTSRLLGLTQSDAPAVISPSLKNLVLYNVYAESLGDLQFMLERVFPNVRQAEIRNLVLIGLHKEGDIEYYHQFPEDWDAMVGRIRSGAGVFASGRVCMSDQGAVIMGVDKAFFPEGRLGHLDDRLFLVAYSALMVGGFSHISPSISSLHLSRIYLPTHFWPCCALRFPNVQSLCLQGPDIQGLSAPSLAQCIDAFPRLSCISISMGNVLKEFDVESGDVSFAVFAACCTGQLRNKCMQLSLPWDGNLEYPSGHVVSDFESAFARYCQHMAELGEHRRVTCVVDSLHKCGSEGCSLCEECEPW